MYRLQRAIEALSVVFGHVAAALIVPLAAVTVFEVFSRYLFNAPTIWAYELAYMGTGTIFLLGIAYTFKEGAHVRIDVLTMNLPRQRNAWLNLIGHLIILFPVVGLVTWSLWEYFLDAYRWGETTGESAWNPVLWPFRLIFVLGLLLFLLQGLAEAIKAVRTLRGADGNG
ncbi:MAG: TRAP transporter small permease subunit [Rhodospirillales bacterium]